MAKILMSYLFIIEILLITINYLEFNIVIKINFIPYEDDKLTPVISFVFNHDVLKMPHIFDQFNKGLNLTHREEIEIYYNQDLYEIPISLDYSTLEFGEIWFQKYNMTADILTNEKLVEKFYIKCIGIDFEYYHVNYSVSYYIDRSVSYNIAEFIKINMILSIRFSENINKNDEVRQLF